MLRSETCLQFIVLNWLWILLWVLNITVTETGVSTACYGGETLSCAQHQLKCKKHMVILITNITFGYRQQGCSNGVSNCKDKSCCKEKKKDCFSPFNQTLLSNLQEYCKLKNACTLNMTLLNEIYGNCFSKTPVFHSYSKVESECIKKTTTPSTTTLPGSTSTPGLTTKNQTVVTTSTTTPLVSSSTPSLTTKNQTSTLPQNGTIPANSNKQDIGGIVGGIVGVIIVGVIVGVAIFLIERRQRTDPGPQEDVTSDCDTEVALPVTIAPVYFELESYNNTDQTTIQLTSSDNYDVIGADNHAKLSKRNDNYNHIGMNVVTSGGDYDYLKGNNSNKTDAVPDCNYNHVGMFTTEEDNYHHIGGNQSEIITEDNYNHIVGHNNTGPESDDYHHIGDSREQLVETDDTYNHIGDDHDEVLAGGEYNHIGYGQELPSMVDVNYSVEDSGDYSADGNDDSTADTAEGIYSLAKRI